MRAQLAEKQTMTEKEFCTAVGLCRTTIWKMRNAGKVPHCKVARKSSTCPNTSHSSSSRKKFPEGVVSSMAGWVQIELRRRKATERIKTSISTFSQTLGIEVAEPQKVLQKELQNSVNLEYYSDVLEQVIQKMGFGSDGSGHIGVTQVTRSNQKGQTKS